MYYIIITCKFICNCPSHGRRDDGRTTSSMQQTRNSDGQPAPTSAKFSRVFIIRDASTGVLTRHPFTEFRASGSPLEGLGLPGDVYLNTKPGSLDLYAKYLDGWKKWPGPEKVDHTLIHPDCPDRYLWFKRDMSAFGWYQNKSLIHSQGELCNILNISKSSIQRSEIGSPSELLSLILKEQARITESSAAQKRKKQTNEDLPGTSSPAKKSRLGPSASDLSIYPNSRPQINRQLPKSSHSNSVSAVSGPSSSRAGGFTGSVGPSSSVQTASSILSHPTLLPPTTSHRALHPQSGLHIPTISPGSIALPSADGSPILTSSLPTSLPQQATEKSLLDQPMAEPISPEVTSVSVTTVSNNDQSDAPSMPMQRLVSMDSIIAATREILRLKEENESLRRCLIAYDPLLNSHTMTKGLKSSQVSFFSCYF